MIFSFSFLCLGIFLFALQSCGEENLYYQETTKENIKDTSKRIESRNAFINFVQSSPDSIKILDEIRELRIDTTNLFVTVEPLTSTCKLKKRGEGDDGIGHRYGVSITQNKTLLDHKIYLVFTEFDGDYTIENVSYTITGLSLGSISTSASNISKSSSTYSSFETTAHWEINYGVGSYTETERIVWGIYFNGGSSISFFTNSF